MSKSKMNQEVDMNTIGGTAFVILASLYKLWLENPVAAEGIFFIFHEDDAKKGYALVDGCIPKITKCMPNFPIDSVLIYQAMAYLDDLGMIRKRQIPAFNNNNEKWGNFIIASDGIKIIEGAKSGDKRRSTLIDRFNLNINFNIESVLKFSAS